MPASKTEAIESALSELTSMLGDLENTIKILGPGQNNADGARWLKLCSVMSSTIEGVIEDLGKTQSDKKRLQLRATMQRYGLKRDRAGESDDSDVEIDIRRK